jgi:Tat protein translocase TatB subunit
MFGMGMNEVLIVMAIAVIVIGPKQLPQVARAMGKLMAQFKRATNDLRTAVHDEVSQHEELEELKEMKSSLEGEIRNIEYDTSSYLEAEFEDERKIGAGVASDLEAAADEIPTRDFDLEPPDSVTEQPAETGEAAAAPPDTGDGEPVADAREAAGGSGGEKDEQPADGAEKPPGGRYV